MQLILLLFLLMSGSSNFKEVRPLLEEVAGEEASRMFDEAEGITRLAAAFAPSKAAAASPASDASVQGRDEVSPQVWPLAPISNLADEDITCCLGRYISTGR